MKCKVKGCLTFVDPDGPPGQVIKLDTVAWHGTSRAVGDPGLFLCLIHSRALAAFLDGQATIVDREPPAGAQF